MSQNVRNKLSPILNRGPEWWQEDLNEFYGLHNTGLQDNQDYKETLSQKQTKQKHTHTRETTKQCFSVKQETGQRVKTYADFHLSTTL